ncbi:tetratricopeptide repeat protein [Dongia mobilis]|uniref:Tetratricopeptide repeat protein n=1 Tax=Dongia mobilis TaxID=578943 RepID=A0A4R6WF68_9PROT|nr:tetratricopeptide repeat protein [Dongia mobilis]TDQ78476.1 tetratricopeptide repeat protein [Dongia mobilis]
MKIRLSVPRLRPALFALALLPAMIACAGEEQGHGAARAETVPGNAPDAQPQEWSLSGAILAGRHAFETGDDAMAAKLYGMILKETDGDPVTASRALAAMVGSGDFASAVELAAKLKQSGARTPLVPLVELADAAQRGDFKAARAALSAFGSDNISRVAKPMFGAWVALGEGKDEAAVLAELDALDAVNGLGGIAVMHRALILDHFGKGAEALPTLRQAAESGYGSARFIELYVDILHRQGDAAPARDYLTRLSADESGIAAAISDPLLERIAQPAPKGPVVEDARRGLAVAMFDLGSLLSSENVNEQAKILARLSLELKDDLDIARLLLGNLMQEGERWQDAIAMYRSIPAGSIYRWSAEISVADCQQKLKDTDGAIATLEGLVAARPNRMEAIVELGDLYRRDQRFTEAIATYDRVIAGIKEPATRDWTLFYARGVAHERAKQWEKAEPDFLKALDLSPDQPYVLNYLAYSWVERRERLDEALDMLHRAVDQRPEEGFIVDSLGWAYYQLGDFEQAVTYLERAVELQPTDPVLNDHLGDAYWRVGRKNEARFQWHRALSFEPEADLVKPIEDKLENGLGAAETPAAPATGN